MTDQGLARRLAEFERRLRGLERGDRLTRSSVVVDDTGRSLGVTAAVVTGSREAALVAARALVALPRTNDPAGQSVWFTDDTPQTLVAGDLWLRPGLDPTLAQLSPDLQWLDLADQSATPAIAGLRSGIATDDGRIIVWSVPTTPVGAPAFGDLWLQAATVAYRWEGTAGWQPLVVAEGQSLNYVAGENGWAITPDGDSQFRDLSAIGQVSGGSAAFDALTVAGSNSLDTLGNSSIGRLLTSRLPQQAANIPLTSVSGTKLFELNCGTVPGGRTYQVSTTMLLQGTGPLAFTDRVVFIYRYTTDGSTPNGSSPSMDGGFNQGYTQVGASTQFTVSAEVDLPAEAQLKVALCGWYNAGSGSYSVFATATTPARPIMSLDDIGPLGARQDSAISLSGGGIARFVKTYDASWSIGVNASYGNTILDSYFHVGGEDDSCGFVGFNSASMVSQLAAATTPISCVARWRPKYRRSSAGLDVRLATHNHVSSAAASAASGGLPYFAYANLAGYGLTLLSNIRNNAVPGTPYEESLGLTVFNQFKAGTRKGLAFLGTPEASTTGGEGLVYGDTTYQMQLVFTYDGTS
jgi:hypothetical protein